MTTTNEINWFEFGSSNGSGSGGKGSGSGSGKGSKNGSGSGSGSWGGNGSGSGSGKGSGNSGKDPAWIKGRLTLDADNNDSETDSVNGGFDEGVEGQVIELYDANNDLVGTTTTDANGMYQFDVVEGNYRVKFPDIDGYKYGVKDADPDPTQDSDANPNGYTDLFCAAGSIQANVDAGLQLLVKNTTDAVDDAATTEVSTPIVVNVLANDTDAEGDAQTITAFDTTSANGGAITSDADGNLVYTPAPGFVGNDTFTYTITDANGAVDTATVTICVEDNLPPNSTVAVDDESATELDTSVVIDVLANDTDPEGDAQEIASFDGTSANGGTVTQDADGNLVYNPAPGFTGTDTFEYTVVDANGATDTGTVTITVEDNAVPNTTDAVDDASTTELDTPIVIEVLGNDTDAEGDTQSVTDFDGVSANGGSVVQNANGDLIYTPAPGFTGMDTFEYTVTDANGATDTATVTVTVEDNSKPNTTDAVDDASTTELDTPIVIEVLGNDTDAEGDTQSVTDFDGVSANGGSVVQNANGDLIYTPAPGFTGTDTFEYTVTDANGATDTATVTVTVEDNSKPNTTDAVDDASTTELDTPIVIEVLGNDTDAEGDTQSVTDFDGVSVNGGSVVQNANGDLIYTPAPGFTGTDTFEYTVTDANGATDTATVTVTVEDNSKPNTTDAVDDASTTELDTPIVIEVLGNDTDAEGDTQSVTDFDGVSVNGGSVVQNANGDLIYTPAPGFTGTDTFEYTVTDANGANDTATVTVTVEDNSKPNTTDAVDDASTTELDTPIVIEVLGNDTDAEGDTQSVTDFDGVSVNGGSVVQNANGDLIYTPAPGFTGTDTFEYTVTDANGATDTATVTVTVEDNSKPNTTDAVDDASTTELDTPIVIEVLGNDTDAEGDTQSVTDFDGVSVNGGSVVQNANGDLIYTPAPGFTGTDTFEYTVTDANGATDTATVTVTVEDNSKPNTTDAVDDTETTDIDTPVVVNVLGNDVDAEGDGQKIEDFDDTSENGGFVALTREGNLVYIPAAGFTGVDTFNYTVIDENGATDVATVTITVEDNSKPNTTDAVDDSSTTGFNSAVDIDVLDNDVDAEGDAQTVTDFDVNSANGGTVTQSADGDLTYTPADGFSGTDTFEYTITDENGATDSATVTVDVEKGPVNTDPNAVDDSGSGQKGDPIVINVLENDTDPEGDPLKIIANTDGASGTVTLDADGNLVYTPNDPDFVGTDSFTYTISDGNGGVDTATVVVEISGKDDPDMIMGTEGNDKRIEGTDGDDHVLGKDGHDCLIISDGDDILDGGSGYDMVIFSSGASSDYFFEANDDGTVTVKGDTGADLLIDIEGVYFEETQEWFKIEDLVEDVH